MQQFVIEEAPVTYRAMAMDVKFVTRMWAAVMLSVVLLAGGGPALAQSAASPPTSPTGEATSTASVVDGGADDYVLGPGDKLRVLVFGETTLSGEFIVAGSGRVSFPLIGEVAAAGLTVQKFRTEIDHELRQGYLREPRVSVEVLTYRPFYILGEVNKPGEYPYTSGLNVLNAVATAGGFTYRAQTKKVLIRRAKEATEQPYPLAADTKVSPGDTIRVPERLF